MNDASDEPIRRAVDRIVRDLAEDIARTYKIDPAAAVEQIRPLVDADAELRRLLGEKGGADAVRRMRPFKDLEKRARRHVYHHLRRYKRTDDMAAAVDRLEQLAPHQAPDIAGAVVQTICQCHVSTAERLPSLPSFHAALLRHVGDARSILDVGAGVLALIFPFDRCARLESYVAAEKDPLAVRAVQAFARWADLARLSALDWALADGWDPVRRRSRAEFDVALLLKIVPVVGRQEPHLLAVLAATPARKLIITGCKEALAKRTPILHREQKTIRTFVQSAGLAIEDQFETQDEIGVVVAR
jgi:hypothetical protein